MIVSGRGDSRSHYTAAQIRVAGSRSMPIYAMEFSVVSPRLTPEEISGPRLLSEMLRKRVAAPPQAAALGRYAERGDLDCDRIAQSIRSWRLPNEYSRGWKVQKRGRFSQPLVLVLLLGCTGNSGTTHPLNDLQ